MKNPPCFQPGECQQNLGVVLLKQGRVPESLSALTLAIALHQATNPNEAQRLRQQLQGMGFETVE
ncbi:MAG: hypothetical protein RLO19_05425 [Coleofasciculus sp. G2-EDA-02]